MIIGIDASRAFLDKRTGTEEYSYQLITHLVALPESGNHTWILYVRPNLKFENFNLKLNSNFKIQIINVPYLWTQLGLAARTWLDKLDVLWIPAHTLPVLRDPRVKTVVTIHGLEYEFLPEYKNNLQAWYLPLSTQYAVRSANKIIAVSEFTKQQLVQRLESDSKKIEVVYEGVSFTSLPAPLLNSGEGRSADRGEVLEKYGLKPKNYLLFIGTVQPRKNLARLIEAFSHITPRPPLNLRGGDNFKLVIAGKLGWDYQEVLAAPQKFGVEQQVKILGYVSESERNLLLQNSLVYVQPSITEGFGLPVIEAAAQGIPVVSSWGGALSEVVKNLYGSELANQVLFDPTDIEEMTEKITNVLKQKPLQEKLKKLGKNTAKKFNWSDTAKETYNILTTT